MAIGDPGIGESVCKPLGTEPQEGDIEHLVISLDKLNLLKVGVVKFLVALNEVILGFTCENKISFRPVEVQNSATGQMHSIGLFWDRFNGFMIAGEEMGSLCSDLDDKDNNNVSNKLIMSIYTKRIEILKSVFLMFPDFREHMNAFHNCVSRTKQNR